MAYAFLLYASRDVKKAIQLVAPDSEPTRFQAEEVLRVLHLQDFLDDPTECRKSLILTYFGEPAKDCSVLGGAICDNCRKTPDHEIMDISNEALRLYDDPGVARGYEQNTLVEALKGTQNPSEDCGFVGIMRFWPTPEIARFLRLLVRARVLKQEVTYHPVSHFVIITITRGVNLIPARDGTLRMPISRSILSDMEQAQQVQSNSTSNALAEAGCKFISPPAIRRTHSGACVKPLSELDFRGCF